LIDSLDLFFLVILLVFNNRITKGQLYLHECFLFFLFKFCIELTEHGAQHQLVHTRFIIFLYFLFSMQPDLDGGDGVEEVYDEKLVLFLYCSNHLEETRFLMRFTHQNDIIPEARSTKENIFFFLEKKR